MVMGALPANPQVGASGGRGVQPAERAWGLAFCDRFTCLITGLLLQMPQRDTLPPFQPVHRCEGSLEYDTYNFYILFSMALLQQCLTLSHHALESFIIDQTESDRAHLLNQLGTHPNIKTISDKVNALWTTMCTQTYLTADRSLVQAMTDKQVRSLRKLTVLSALAQKNSVSVEELVRQLDLKRVDVYRLLTEMSGENLITVRIDEENSLVHILASKRRQNPSLGRSQLVAECEHRLHRILADNKKLMEFLSRNSVVK